MCVIHTHHTRTSHIPHRQSVYIYIKSVQAAQAQAQQAAAAGSVDAIRDSRFRMRFAQSAAGRDKISMMYSIGDSRETGGINVEKASYIYIRSLDIYLHIGRFGD